MEVLQLSNLKFKDLIIAIRKYHSLDFKTISITEAEKLLRLIIKHYPSQTLIWKAESVYRARKNDTEENFKNISELIYPKNPTKLGRLNDIGQSLFYSASDQNTTLLEMRPKIGDEITILQSKLIDNNLHPKYMEIGIKELVKNQNVNPEFTRNVEVSLNKMLVTKDNKKRYKIITKFLMDELSKIVNENEVYNYKGTITIGQFFMNNNFSDGLLYPSISRSGAECVAIKPESYHKFYYPFYCHKSLVVDINEKGEYGMIYLNTSTNIDKDGKIFWDEPLQYSKLK